MRTNVYSVFDRAAAAYLHPYNQVNHASAIRSFGQACRSDAHQFAQYPEDYTLFYIGEFDEQTGKLHPITPEKIISALEFLASDNEKRKPENQVDAFA